MTDAGWAMSLCGQDVPQTDCERVLWNVTQAQAGIIAAQRERLDAFGACADVRPGWWWPACFGVVIAGCLFAFIVSLAVLDWRRARR
jgi:hypothetical protein